MCEFHIKNGKFTSSQCQNCNWNWVNCQILLLHFFFSSTAVWGAGKLFSVLDFHLKVTTFRTTARLYCFMAMIYTPYIRAIWCYACYWHIIVCSVVSRSQVVFIWNLMLVLPQQIENLFVLWMRMAMVYLRQRQPRRWCCLSMVPGT